MTPENADHDFEGKAGARAGGSISPDGRFIIDSYSTVTEPDKAVLRAIGGKVITSIVAADISELVAAGWQPPERFVVKAADGTTDLYGDLYKPMKFDPAKRYPVIEVLYPADNTKFAPTSFRDQFTGSATRDAFRFRRDRRDRGVRGRPGDGFIARCSSARHSTIITRTSAPPSIMSRQSVIWARLALTWI